MPLSRGEGRGEGLSLLAPSPGVAPSLATDNLRSHTRFVVLTCTLAGPWQASQPMPGSAKVSCIPGRLS